jgi:hypothetical protein
LLGSGAVDGARYEVFCGDATVCLAQNVVLNMPPVQLLQVAADVLAYTDAELLRKVTMEPCWALGGCLSTDIPLDAVAVECQHDVLGWISRNHTRRSAGDSPASIMVHANGCWSAAHIEDDKVEVRAALEAAMNEIGMPISWDGEPFVRRWRYARPAVSLNADYFAASESPGIYGIGDWCQGGRVEGAICSGWSVARKLELL